MSRSGRLDVVASKEHDRFRVGIACADRSVVADISMDVVMQLVERALLGERVVRAEAQISTAGILAPPGGLVLRIREKGVIDVDISEDPVRIQIVLPGSQSSKIVIWQEAMKSLIRFLGAHRHAYDG